MPTLASMLDSTKTVVYVMCSIIFIAIGFLILNTMLMAGVERVREFGILKALGVGPSKVMVLILIESLIQATISILFSIIFSIPLIRYLSKQGIDLGMESGTSLLGLAWDPVIYAVINIETFFIPIIMFTFIVALAVLYPAGKAALISPIKAMYHR